MLSVLAKQTNCLSRFLNDKEKKYPRTFNILCVIICLLLLICVALFFGHFLAVLERDGELDDAIQLEKDNIERIRAINGVDNVAKLHRFCVDSYIKSVAADQQKIFNGSELKEFIQTCTESKTRDIRNTMFRSIVADLEHKELNWNKCLPSTSQASIDFWILLLSENLPEGIDINTATEIDFGSLRDEMDKLCTANTEGGAWFWFTIMTTIGYGNTAPVTIGGKILVFTAGFLSIIAFAAVVGMSGNTFLAIVDDFFLSRKWEKMTKGWISVLFWLVVFFLYIVMLAGFGRLFLEVRYDSIPLDFGNNIWWSYISFTTIGLGDYYIPHADFEWHDIWWMSFLFLFGFVFFANFALKLGETLYDSIRRHGIVNGYLLSDLLKATRHTSLQESDDNTKPKDLNNKEKVSLPSEIAVDIDT